MLKMRHHAALSSKTLQNVTSDARRLMCDGRELTSESLATSDVNINVTSDARRLTCDGRELTSETLATSDVNINVYV